MYGFFYEWKRDDDEEVGSGDCGRVEGSRVETEEERKQERGGSCNDGTAGNGGNLKAHLSCLILCKMLSIFCTCAKSINAVLNVVQTL